MNKLIEKHQQTNGIGTGVLKAPSSYEKISAPWVKAYKPKAKTKYIKSPKKEGLLKRGLNWLGNSIQATSIIESPAVMTAAGWKIDRNGQVKQDQQTTKGVKQLRNNITTIGEAGITAPTMVGDIEGFYNIIRHPKQTLNFIQQGLSKIPIFRQQMKVGDLLDNSRYMTEDILKGAKEGFKDSYKYYSSDKYIEHLKSTGLSEKEAKELQQLKLNNLLDTRINFDNVNPAAYGENVVRATGESTTSLNPRIANTEDLARETVWHESGAHSASKNYKSSYQPKIDRSVDARNIYSNPWYRRISEHNSQLIPELKPVWKAFMEGDMKTFNKLASKEDLEIIKKYENPKGFIEYLEDEQEAAARAISANIGDYTGKKSQWNLPQLEQFFTSEGIKKLRDNVWSIGTGFGGMLFINEDWAMPQKKKGGKLISRNPIIRFKNRIK